MRTGRPTDNPKKYRVDIRLTEDEMIMLNECVEHFQRSKTEILLEGLEKMHTMMEGKKDGKE